MATFSPAAGRADPRVDAATVGALAVLAALGLAFVGTPVAALFGLGLVGPLVWRRSHPRRMVVGVLLAGSALLAAQAVGQPAGLRGLFTPGLDQAVWVAVPVVLVAVHCAAAHGSVRLSVVAAALAMAAVGLEAAHLSGPTLGVGPALSLLTLAGFAALTVAVSWGLGMVRRSGPHPSPAVEAVATATPGQRLFGDQLDGWLRAHVGLVDALSAAGVTLLLTSAALSSVGVVNGVQTALMLVPLAWRRTLPVRCMVVVATISLGIWLLDLTAVLPALLGHAAGVTTALPPTPRLGSVAVFVVIYSVTAYASRRAGLVALTLGAVGAVLEVCLLFAVELRAGQLSSVASTLGFVLIAVAASWAFGALRKARVTGVEVLRERARLLEVERDQQARLATSAERARIARELHDVVAHSLAVVIAQADGGRYAAAASPGAAEQALATIGDTGRRALAEMRELLGVLRDGAGDPNTPQPDVEAIPALVGQVAAAGLEVSLDVQGTPRPLTRTAGLAAYRIVQEGLTNVMKHAGPGAAAQVRLGWSDDRLELLVQDDGRGAAASAGDGGGQGLVGMTERAALCGGRLEAGPRPGGGFGVRAVLPVAGSGALG